MFRFSIQNFIPTQVAPVQPNTNKREDSSKDKIINVVEPLKENRRLSSRHYVSLPPTLVITKVTLLRFDNLMTFIIPSPRNRQMNIQAKN